jgi:Arc/MetJ-type ribon-helix-helix transcriptional regulator
MKQVTVNLTEEQHAALKLRASETGLLQSEIIRRSLARTLTPETEQRAARSAQPVLFTTKAGN